MKIKMSLEYSKNNLKLFFSSNRRDTVRVVQKQIFINQIISNKKIFLTIKKNVSAKHKNYISLNQMFKNNNNQITFLYGK